MMGAYKKISAIVSAVLIIILSGCRDGGDIGHLFGTWAIDSYTVDGVKIENNLVENSTLSFQSNIVNIVTVIDDYATAYSVFGTWSEEGDTFVLNFTHHDDERPSGTDLYAAPAWLGMTSDEPMVMNISDNKKNSFTLTWTDSEGLVKVYKLYKTW